MGHNHIFITYLLTNGTIKGRKKIDKKERKKGMILKPLFWKQISITFKIHFSAV